MHQTIRLYRDADVGPNHADLIKALERKSPAQRAEADSQRQKSFELTMRATSGRYLSHLQRCNSCKTEGVVCGTATRLRDAWVVARRAAGEEE